MQRMLSREKYLTDLQYAAQIAGTSSCDPIIPARYLPKKPHERIQMAKCVDMYAMVKLISPYSISAKRTGLAVHRLGPM